MTVKDGGADMQPEFDRTFARQAGPRYEPVKSAGWVQDELRRQEGGRQTLGDPEEYSNEASAGTANTPVKPSRAKTADD